MPTSLDHRDAVGMPAPAQDQRMSQATRPFGGHLIASPFGTIEPATYTYARPLGTSMPRPPRFELASFNPAAVSDSAFAVEGAAETDQIVYPSVNRRRKGDRLPVAAPPPAPASAAPLPQLQPIDATPDAAPSMTPAAPPAAPPRPARANTAAAPAHPSANMPLVRITPILAPRERGGDEGDITGSIHRAPVPAPRPGNLLSGSSAVVADLPPELPASGQIDSSAGTASDLGLVPFAEDDLADHTTQIYFDARQTGGAGGLEGWAPGMAPIMVRATEDGIRLSSVTDPDEALDPSGEKDEAARAHTPAERLGLEGKARQRAEKCLADAVYFEARGEPLLGQEAVAQVVMNRVFSGYYPRSVCGVVFQNASHYLACQFTFACEHKNLSRIDEPEMWEQAKRIAKDTLDGKIWLKQVGHATHYHAYWVHPGWVHEMTKLYKLGVHTFYRPRAWGSGDDEPAWGAAPRASKSNSEATQPQAQAAPRPAGAAGATAL